MAFKFIAVSCLLAVAAAGPLAPLTKVAYAEPHYPPAQYEYTYSIEDHQSGDIKQQKESRNGDAVQGFYSLVQPDGTQRIVEYTADDVHGFNAVVRYEGQAAPAKVAYAAPVAKIAYAQPAPVAYSAPIAKVAYAQAAPVAYAAPVAKIAYAAAPKIEYAHSAPAPVQYAHAPAPVQYTHAPAHVQYAHAPAQVQYAHAPAHVQYAHAPAPTQYAHTPVAKVAYSTNLGHVTFSSPAVSYHH